MPKKRKGVKNAKAAVRPNGEILIYGIVGDEFDGLDAKTLIQEIDNLGDCAQLAVRINSHGGYVTQGLAFFNYLANHKAHKIVHVDGIAASMASVLAMAGDEIIMPSNAMMMIHNPWDVAIGDAEEIRKSADMLDKMKDALVGIYAARSGQDEDTISQMMNEETWMTAEEALDLGFASQVVEPVQAAAFHTVDLGGFRNVPEVLQAHSLAASAAADLQDTRSHDMAVKGKKNGKAETKAADTENENNVQASGDADAAQAEAANAAQAATVAERARAKGIRTAVAAVGLGSDLAEELIDKGVSLEEARAQIIDAKAEAQGVDDGGEEPRGHQRVVVVNDATERFRTGAALALMARASMDGGERNEFTGLTLGELARMSLDVRNISARGMDRMQMIGVAFNPMAAGMHTGSDFTNILADVANKAMLKGYDEAEETFPLWTTTGVLTDFKPTKRPDLNSFPNLAKVEDGAEYTYATMGDRGELIQLATYGKLFSITRHTIVNDDLDAFTRVPRRMGRAAIRTVGNLVYSVLTSNPAMADGDALFHANHNNLGTAGAPSVAAWEEARTKMGTQKDGDAILNITPAFMLVPKALEGTAKTLKASETDPSKSNSKVPNSVRDTFEVVADGRLDADSATQWYGAAHPGQHDTVEVSYLDGQETPFLEQQNGWTVDGTDFKVRQDAGVKALDFRTMFRNAG